MPLPQGSATAGVLSDRRKSAPKATRLPILERIHNNDLIEQTRRSVPFDHVSFTGLDIDGLRFGAGAYLRSDFPTATLEAYYSESMVGVDPLVKAVIGAEAAVTEEQAFDEAGTVDQRLLALLRSGGIRNRTVVPLSRNGSTYGAMCVTREKPFNESELSFLSLVAEPLHKILTKPGVDRFALHNQILTAGELLCLRHASRGMTSEEIGHATGYTTETVNSYLKSAPRKLGATNRVEAVANAIRRGLID
jgi:DNA-binding CsgD family transcriptional regulator